METPTEKEALFKASAVSEEDSERDHATRRRRRAEEEEEEEEGLFKANALN